MRQVYSALFYLLLISTLSACNKSDTPQANIDAPSSQPISTSNSLLDGTYCFKKISNQDVVNVQIIILANDVTGFMNWVPYQKDSARGTLKGVKNAAGEFDLIYSYTIEGSQQTETKIMKIQNAQLWIKQGELEDPKYDGNLVYKDVTQAKYTEHLDKADCATLTG